MDGRDAAVGRRWSIGVAMAVPGLVAAAVYAGLVVVAARLVPDALADAVQSSRVPR